jgi:hypothetical protein
MKSKRDWLISLFTLLVVIFGVLIVVAIVGLILSLLPAILWSQWLVILGLVFFGLVFSFVILIALIH